MCVWEGGVEGYVWGGQGRWRVRVWEAMCPVSFVLCGWEREGGEGERGWGGMEGGWVA